VRLVLIGGEGGEDDALRALAAQLGVARRVDRRGRVTDDERNRLVAGASALVFPSRYEGFGAPVLEAMAAGVPVVASRISALREVVGDSGLLVPPDDERTWADAIRSVLDDAAPWRASGRARASSFTAARSAEALVELCKASAATR
jgi:glycosyltransferase involved in cell wall biosynthesis